LLSRNAQTWVKRPKFQITERVVTMISSGRRIGRMMVRSVCHGLAPSTIAASRSSCGTWVRPACSVIARNGMPAQTTSVVMTIQPWVGLANQLWLAKSTPGIWSIR
jgi:hypothetical protein